MTMRYRIFTVEVEGIDLDVQLDTKPNSIPVTAIFPVHDEVDLMPVMKQSAIDEARDKAKAMYWEAEPHLHAEEGLPCGWRDAA
jgi:hypothetical protein